MSTGLALIRENQDVAKRRHMPPGEINTEDEWLGRLYASWERLRSGDSLPKRAAFDPVALMRFADGRVHIVETPAADPQDYRFQLWGHMIDFDAGADYTERRLAEMPHTTMRRAALEDYADTVMSGTPSYQLIYNLENGREHTYSRLILPVTADGRRVTQLLVAINQRPIAEFDNRSASGPRPSLRLVHPE